MYIFKDLLNLIVENFWLIFFIIVLITGRKYRTVGILLLMVKAIFGDVAWYYWSIIIIYFAYIMIYSPRKYWENWYKRKLKSALKRLYNQQQDDGIIDLDDEN